MADLRGHRPVLLGVLSAVLVGCIVCAGARSIQVLVAGRILQGTGGAVIAVLYGIVRDQAPAGRIAGRIGLLSSMLAVGGGLGLVLAGPVSARLGYHWIFAPPLALTAAALLGVRAFVPRSPAVATGRVAWGSALALSAWLCTLLTAISEGPAWGWRSGRILFLAAAMASLVAIWIALERRAQSPLVDLDLMRLPVIWRANLASLLLGAGMFSVNLLAPALVEMTRRAGYGFGLSASKAGLFMLPVSHPD